MVKAMPLNENMFYNHSLMLIVVQFSRYVCTTDKHYYKDQHECIILLVDMKHTRDGFKSNSSTVSKAYTEAMKNSFDLG